MTQSNHEGYRYLHVYRPVTNIPDDFTSKITKLSARIFGQEVSTSIEETGLLLPALFEGEPGQAEPVKTLTTVGHDVFDVYSPTALRLILQRRTVSAGMSGYNFNSHAGHFTSSKTLAHRTKSGRVYTKGSKNKVRSDFNEISSSYGLNPQSLVVTFDHVQEISDRGFGRELALAPKIGHLASEVLNEEADYCMEALEGLAPRTANPSSPTSCVVPFMRLPHLLPGNRRKERFMDLIQDSELKILPVVLVLGKMWANSDEIVGTGG